jgi:hypothetical protein
MAEVLSSKTSPFAHLIMLPMHHPINATLRTHPIQYLQYIHLISRLYKWELSALNGRHAIKLRLIIFP